MVAINLDGCLLKKLTMPAKAFFCFLSISTLSLLEETKAISIPEKKAEKNIETSIRVISCRKFMAYLRVILERLLKKYMVNARKEKRK